MEPLPEIVIGYNKQLTVFIMLLLVLLACHVCYALPRGLVKSFQEWPKTGSFLFALLAVMLINLSRQLFRKNGRIRLSAEGIDIKNEEFNAWEYVKGLEKIVEHSRGDDYAYLLITLMDNREIKVAIYDLDGDPDEIMMMVYRYKKASVNRQ